MAKTQLNKQPKIKLEHSSSLKGTLAAVFLLGLFLIISWAAVFVLFLNRF